MSLSLYCTPLTLYAEPSTTMFYCPSNNTDMLNTNDAVVSAIVIQGVGLPADEPESIKDDGNGHETHRSAMNINIPAASANSNLRHLWEGLRNTNKQKLVRACDCGESVNAVEAEDEARIIICRRKGCETLWVSVFGIISVSLLTIDYAVPPFMCQTGSWYQRLDLWPMQECREKQGKGRAAANEEVQCRCKAAAERHPKHVLFIAYTYIWKFIHTPS